MKITVRNFRQIAEAVTDEARLTMITGPNQAGKTSLLQSVAAAMLGTASVYGSTAKKLETVIRTGQDLASAKVEFEGGGEASISWPREIWQRPPLPDVDEITMGRVDPAKQFDRRQWADFIRTIAGPGAKITRSMLKAELEKLPGYSVTAGEQTVENAGKDWSSAARIAQEEARRFKREWQKITGQPFGEVKAEGWRALHYVSGDVKEDLDSKISELTSKINMRKAHDDLSEETEEEINARIAVNAEKLQKVEDNLSFIGNKIAVAEEEFRKYPTSDPVACPHCAGLVEIHGDRLAMPGDLRRNTDEYRAMVTSLGELGNRQAELKQQQSEIRARLTCDRNVLAAVGKIKHQDIDNRPISEMADELKNLELRLGALTASSAAENVFWRVMYQLGAYRLLCATGLRLMAILKALPTVQEQIDEIAADIFAGHEVKLEVAEDGIDLLFDGHSYTSLTWPNDPNSYGLRIQYMFQLIRARTYGPDTPVLLDRADTLEKTQLQALLGHLVKHNVHAVVARSLSKKPDADLLKKAGKGLTYWINNGKLEAI